MIGNILIQLVFALVILATTIIVGIFPFYMHACRESASFASIGNCFSAGVFLSVALINLLPEGSSYIRDSIGNVTPLGHILVVVGYLLILLVERVIFTT